MKRVGLVLSMSILSLFATAPAASGAIVANWTFETSQPASAGPHNAEAGVAAGAASQALRTVDSGGTPNTSGGMPGNGSAWSFNSRPWRTDDTLRFRTDTTGYTAITFQWCWARSDADAPGQFALEWSTNGSSWSFLNNQNVGIATWSAATPNANSCVGPIAMPAGLDNQANAFIRLRSLSDATNGFSTIRFDDVVVSGVPEPASLGLLAVGGLMLIRRRR